MSELKDYPTLQEFTKRYGTKGRVVNETIVQSGKDFFRWSYDPKYQQFYWARITREMTATDPEGERWDA